MTRPITIAILAKDKAHTLPLYLRCVEQLNWPRKDTLLYVRTNNNNDATAAILADWIERVGGSYADVHFDASDVPARVQDYGQHEWNAERFAVLARIRQDSMDWALARGSHYFVVDCDNFVRRDTVTALERTGLPIVAPLLHSATAYSNYHAAIDANGYFADTPFYYQLLRQEIRGLIEVPVVHCAYLVRHEVIPRLHYHDGSGRHEYVIFSDAARRAAVPQYLDTRRSYGRISFAENADQLAAEPWRHELAVPD